MIRVISSVSVCARAMIIPWSNPNVMKHYFDGGELCVGGIPRIIMSTFAPIG
jgi:hypothetical protein